MKWGRVRLGEERIYSLSYADDIVFVAEDKGSIKSMMERLENYLDGKGLVVNMEKTNI